MGQSQLVEFTAREEHVSQSQLVEFGAFTEASTGTSELVEFSAFIEGSLGRSRLVEFSAFVDISGVPVAVLTGPTEVEPYESFVLSLSTSLGGPFTAYVFTQLSGPAAYSFVVSGDHVTVKAPIVPPESAGFPNEANPVMVFQGRVELGGGAQVDADTQTVTLRPHNIWDDDGPLAFHFA